MGTSFDFPLSTLCFAGPCMCVVHKYTIYLCTCIHACNCVTLDYLFLFGPLLLYEKEGQSIHTESQYMLFSLQIHCWCLPGLPKPRVMMTSRELGSTIVLTSIASSCVFLVAFDVSQCQHALLYEMEHICMYLGLCVLCLGCLDTLGCMVTCILCSE